MIQYFDIQSVLSRIQSGNTIVTAMAACEPFLFFSSCHEKLKNLKDVTIFCANPSQNFPLFHQEELSGKLRIFPMFLTSAIRQSQGHGVVHYFPQHLSRWTESIKKRGPIDIFWGSCSVPDERGFVSLGLSASYESEMIQCAKTVILEVNPNMPVTYGATTIAIDQVDFFVQSNQPLPTLNHDKNLSAEDKQIAKFIFDLIPDGATIQLGIGAIPEAVGIAIENKKDLGVHTELFNDAMMHLFQKGVINGRHKSIWPGKMIAAFAYGSKSLYDFIDQNPLIEFHPASVVNDPYRIGRNHKMISINSAVEVDLTGQVCSESIGHMELSGVGGATDTHIGAQRSQGGRGIIALHSTTRNAEISKIVFELTPGAKVSISRNDIDTVVTEFGVAHLCGKSVSERVKAMISLAHPKFRETLQAKAAEYRYL